MTPRLFVPLLEPEDVIRHLGKGVKHWKAGRSAHALANRWFTANGGIPSIVGASFKMHPVFSGARLVDGFLERSVDLPDGARPTQTDLLALLRLKHGLAVAAVEGKVDESFGPLISEWLDKGGSKERLSMLCGMLGLKTYASTLRYQLFHRTVSALIEAERYCAKTALLLVHSFSPQRACFSDFAGFLAALEMSNAAEPATLYGPRPCRIADSAVDLYAVWIADDCADVSDEDLFWNRLRAYAERLNGEGAELIGWANSRTGRT